MEPDVDPDAPELGVPLLEVVEPEAPLLAAPVPVAAPVEPTDPVLLSAPGDDVPPVAGVVVPEVCPPPVFPTELEVPVVLAPPEPVSLPMVADPGAPVPAAPDGASTPAADLFPFLSQAVRPPRVNATAVARMAELPMRCTMLEFMNVSDVGQLKPPKKMLKGSVALALPRHPGRRLRTIFGGLLHRVALTETLSQFRAGGPDPAS